MGYEGWHDRGNDVIKQIVVNHIGSWMESIPIPLKLSSSLLWNIGSGTEFNEFELGR